MVHINLRLACLTIAAILYSAQAAPASGFGSGDAVSGQVAQKIGAGAPSDLPPYNLAQQIQAIHARQVEYGRYLMRRVYSNNPAAHHTISGGFHTHAAQEHELAAARFAASGTAEHQQKAQEHAAKAAAHRAEANNHHLAATGQAHGAFHMDTVNPEHSAYGAHQSLRDHGLAHDPNLATAGDHHDAAVLQNFHAGNRVGGNIPKPY